MEQEPEQKYTNILAQRVYKKLNRLLTIWKWDKHTPDIEKGALIQPNMSRLANLSLKRCLYKLVIADCKIERTENMTTKKNYRFLICCDFNLNKDILPTTISNRNNFQSENQYIRNFWSWWRKFV